MADRTLGISMVVGAALGSTFRSTIRGAETRIKGLGSTISKLESEPTNKLMQGFYRLRDRVRDSRRELRAAEEDLSSLKAQADAAGGASGMLARRIEKTERRVKRLRSSVNSASHQFLDHKAKLADTGQGLDELIPKYRRLASEMDRAKSAQERLQRVEARHQTVLNKRADLRGQAFDALALGSMVAAPVMQSMQAADARARLSTVLNADDKDAALAQANQAARDMAKSGLVTLMEGYDIQYALNSAGLSAAAARSASQVVAKVAKVTSGVPERVGEVVATTFNNLGSALEGSTEQKLGRIGDLLTKAQLKFQIRDFGQLGDSMSEGAAGLANYNVQLEQGVTLLGQLNTAGLQGGRAGTALNAVLRSLGKAQEEWGIELVRNERGQLDMLATLGQLREALADMDQDTRAQALQQVFGDEGAKGVVPLLNNLDQLTDAYQDVAEGSKGIVNREVARFTENAAGQWRKLTGTLSVMGDIIGSTVLPGLTGVLSVLVSILGPVAAFAAENKTLTTVVAGVVVGLVALKVASIGLGYAWTFVHGGALMVQKAILLIGSAAKWTAVKTALLGAAQKAWAIGQAVVTGACTAISTAFRAMSVAVMTNPIGLVIGGIAIAAGLLIAYWKPVSEWFVGMWQKFGPVIKVCLGPIGLMIHAAEMLIKHWRPVLDWLTGVWDTVVGAIQAAWEKIKSLPIVGLAIKGASAIGGAIGSLGKAIGGLFGGGEEKPEAKPASREAQATSSTETASRGERVERVVQATPGKPPPITINQTINVNGGDPAAVKSAVNQANDGIEDRIRSVVQDMFRERERTAYA